MGLSEARRLLEMLLEDFWGERRFWDRFDCLNSDGRRLLHNATKAILDEEPGLRRLVYRVRREPCRGMVEKLLEAIGGFKPGGCLDGLQRRGPDAGV